VAQPDKAVRWPIIQHNDPAHNLTASTPPPVSVAHRPIPDMMAQSNHSRASFSAVCCIWSPRQRGSKRRQDHTVFDQGPIANLYIHSSTVPTIANAATAPYSIMAGVEEKSTFATFNAVYTDQFACIARWCVLQISAICDRSDCLGRQMICHPHQA
jgi:hypothetical protein